MNTSSKWVGALNDAGFPSVHWSEVGNVEALDTSIANYAAANAAVILTRDLDFAAILSSNGDNAPSVILLREVDRFQPVTVARVIIALRTLAEELEAGAIVSLSANRLRVRRLPIGREGAA